METTINIDDLPPLRALEDIRHAEEVMKDLNIDRRKAERFRSHVHSFRNRAGFSYRKLLNWRSLERRWFEIYSRYCEYTNEVLSSLKILHAHVSAGGTKEIWMPTANSEYAHVFNGDYLTTRTTLDLVKCAVPDPNMRPYVLQGDELKRAHVLLERERTFKLRAAPYRDAFEEAVKARLMPFIQQNLRLSPKYHIFRRAAFVVKNDSRQYVIMTDQQGAITWDDEGVVFVSL